MALKAAINYFRQLHRACWLCHNNQYIEYNIYSYAIIRTINVPSPVRLLQLVNGQTCDFCLIHPQDPLENPFGIFACQTCLGYDSELNLIKVFNLKRRSFSSQRRNWSPIFGHTKATFLWITDDVLFSWRSNHESFTGEKVSHWFTLTDLKKITNLINEKGLNCNY